MNSNLLEIGKIATTHGIKGDIKINPLCDDPYQILEFKFVYYSDGTKIKLNSPRVHKNTVIARIDGYNTPEEARILVGKMLYAKREDFNLPEGTYFIADLEGLNVFDVDTNECYGRIKSVFQTGANDVYEVENEGKTYLIPAIKDVVISVSIEEKEMKIRPLRGLFDE